jgi:hypothetical protein
MLAINMSRLRGGSRLNAYVGDKFIGCFETQAEACRELGLQVGNLNKVLRGERPHTGGYSFERVSGTPAP